MVTSRYLGETLNIRERWRLWKRVRSNWSSDFLKKSAQSRSCYYDCDRGFIRLVFPSVPDLLRHMAEIARMHSYPFESTLPLYQSLKGAGE
jgi:hypothetical protein